MTNGDLVWIRDQDRLGKIRGNTQQPRSFVNETEKGTFRRNRSALVKAEVKSPSKVHKQVTFTSTAEDHAVQDKEEMTDPSKFPCTRIETPMQPAPSQTAPLQTRSGRIVKPHDRLVFFTYDTDEVLQSVMPSIICQNNINS